MTESSERTQSVATADRPIGLVRDALRDAEAAGHTTLMRTAGLSSHHVQKALRQLAAENDAAAEAPATRLPTSCRRGPPTLTICRLHLKTATGRPGFRSPSASPRLAIRIFG